MVKLEKGDYVIHVHIIEARDLKPRDAGDTSDPVCEVSVMGVKKSTQIHKEFGPLFYDMYRLCRETMVHFPQNRKWVAISDLSTFCIY